MWTQHFNRLKITVGAVLAGVSLGGFASAQTLPGRVQVGPIRSTPSYPVAPLNSSDGTVRPTPYASPADSSASQIARSGFSTDRPRLAPSERPSGAPGEGFGSNATPMTGRAGISGSGTSNVPRTDTDRILVGKAGAVGATGSTGGTGSTAGGSGYVGGTGAMLGGTGSTAGPSGGSIITGAIGTGAPISRAGAAAAGIGTAGGS